MILREAIFDIETNGLLDKLDRVHSLCIRDGETGALVMSCCDQPGRPSIREGLKVLSAAEKVIGHNIIDFDLPALEKVYPDWTIERGSNVVDTLLLSRVLWPEIKHGDMIRWKKGNLPGNLIGRFGLEAWGHRLGVHKGDYKAAREALAKSQGITDKEALVAFVWGSWNPSMQDYCDLDTEVNWHLWKAIKKKNLDPRVSALETRVAEVCRWIGRDGFSFNLHAAGNLYADLCARRDAAKKRLQAAFPPVERSTTILPKVNNAKLGYKKGVPFTKTKLEDFNPGSSEHIQERLKAKYGWVTTQKTDKGNPKLDEDTLGGLPFAEIPDLLDYLFHAKMIGFLSGGTATKPSGWLHAVTPQGRIHGTINSLGTVTGRASHSIIVNVPKVKKDKIKGILKGYEGDYGWEMRGLFGPGEFPYQVGCDFSGLELRCLAHELFPYDGGEYMRLVTEGDVHTKNMVDAGLPSRDAAKTFIYAFIYGSGEENLGWLLGVRGTPVLDKRTGFMVDMEAKAAGAAAKRRLFKANPALKELIDDVKKEAKATGFLVGLDGRPLTVRKPHAALNTRLQSTGAILCKRWVVRTKIEMDRLKFTYGGDWRYLTWPHDETQSAARTLETAEALADAAKRMTQEAGEFYDFRCPLAGDAMIGRTWAECH